MSSIDDNIKKLLNESMDLDEGFETALNEAGVLGISNFMKSAFPQAKQVANPKKIEKAYQKYVKLADKYYKVRNRVLTLQRSLLESEIKKYEGTRFENLEGVQKMREMLTQTEKSIQDNEAAAQIHNADKESASDIIFKGEEPDQAELQKDKEQAVAADKEMVQADAAEEEVVDAIEGGAEAAEQGDEAPVIPDDAEGKEEVTGDEDSEETPEEEPSEEYEDIDNLVNLYINGDRDSQEWAQAVEKIHALKAAGKDEELKAAYAKVQQDTESGAAPEPVAEPEAETPAEEPVAPNAVTKSVKEYKEAADGAVREHGVSKDANGGSVFFIKTPKTTKNITQGEDGSFTITDEASGESKTFENMAQLRSYISKNKFATTRNKLGVNLAEWAVANPSGNVPEKMKTAVKKTRKKKADKLQTPNPEDLKEPETPPVAEPEEEPVDSEPVEPPIVEPEPTPEEPVVEPEEEPIASEPAAPPIAKPKPKSGGAQRRNTQRTKARSSEFETEEPDRDPDDVIRGQRGEIKVWNDPEDKDSVILKPNDLKPWKLKRSHVPALITSKPKVLETFGFGEKQIEQLNKLMNPNFNSDINAKPELQQAELPPDDEKDQAAE